MCVLGKYSEASSKVASSVNHIFRRRTLIGTDQTTIQVAGPSDEVDEGNNSDEEGSVEQEIRLSVSIYTLWQLLL